MTDDTVILPRRLLQPTCTASALTAATVAHDAALAVLPREQHPMLDAAYADTVWALLNTVHYAARRAA